MGSEYLKRLLGKSFEAPIEPLGVQFDAKVKELGLTFNGASELLQIARPSLKRILEGEAKSISFSNMIRIGSFLGYSNHDEFFLNFFNHLGPEEIGEFERIFRTQFILENFHLPGLKKIGLISQIKDFQVLEYRLKSYFGLASIYDYQDKVGVRFSRGKLSPNEKMLRFWVRSAYSYVEAIANPNSYDRSRLIKLIPQIRPYCQDVPNGLRTVVKALFRVGITVLFQPYLPQTQIRGATFAVDGKPCIVITDLHKNYGTLWFALMHELYHVLYDLDDIEAEQYHLTEEDKDSLFISEKRANDFARDYLFNEAKMNYIRPFIGNEHMVKQYARQCEVHPSIIYSLFAWQVHQEGSNYWPLAKKQSPDINIALASLNKSIWEAKSIEEAAVSLKNTLYKLN